MIQIDPPPTILDDVTKFTEFLPGVFPKGVVMSFPSNFSASLAMISTAALHLPALEHTQ